MSLELLCISNGHGEDAIAIRILQALQEARSDIDIQVLPIVGKGHGYRDQGFSIVGTPQQLPSGGFLYMDGRQLWRDLRGGLLDLTWKQLGAVKHWAKGRSPRKKMVLAVGDLVPLLFAWWSGAEFAFVGTAKSEYYWQDEGGWLPQTSPWDRRWGSIYLPWERWFLGHGRCRGVFPRDQLTTEILRRWPIPALDLGNPMMDGLEGAIAPAVPDSFQFAQLDPLEVLLLPGSRWPEVHHNWQILLQGINHLGEHFSPRALIYHGAIAPGLCLDPLINALTHQGWQPHHSPIASLEDPGIRWFFRPGHQWLGLSQSHYRTYVQRAHWAIAMAGTATEQFVGCGKPAFTLPGPGPQFTPAFAEAQTRLLGESVIFVEHPSQLVIAIETTFQDPATLQRIHHNGRHRLGAPGASRRIAQALLKNLPQETGPVR